MTSYSFELEPETIPDVKEGVDACLEQIFAFEESALFSVVLHNDAVNGVDFVSSAIMSVFGYSLSRSVWLMLKAHFAGKSILWSGKCDDATKKRIQLLNLGADPNMIDKGAEPLVVTVERQL